MKRDTKNEILKESLMLFAKDGYEGVTVRDIAKQLGIQASSLYKHFENKQAIFEGIVERMNEEYGEMVKSIQLPKGDYFNRAKEYGNKDISVIKEIGEKLFCYWTQDVYASAFRRMLILEQYRNDDMKKLYQEYLVEGVLDYEEKLFAQMILGGYFKGENPRQLALEFYGPIFVLMTVYDGKEDKTDIINQVAMHIETFGRYHDKSFKKEG